VTGLYLRQKIVFGKTQFSKGPRSRDVPGTRYSNKEEGGKDADDKWDKAQEKLPQGLGSRYKKAERRSIYVDKERIKPQTKKELRLSHKL